MSLTARLAGTPVRPQLQVVTGGEQVSAGRLHGLDFQGDLGITDKVKLTFGAQSQGDVVATVEAGAALSGAELLELVERRNDREAIAPLLDRSVSVSMSIPGLPIARASQLAGKKAVAEGKLTGRLALTGTPARPRLVSQLTLKDLTSAQKKLGAVDFYVEADGSGGLMHLGIDPPGGGSFLGHATLKADLGARALLRDGFAPVLDGTLSGRVQAKQLDLAFLSGLAPRL